MKSIQSLARYFVITLLFSVLLVGGTIAEPQKEASKDMAPIKVKVQPSTKEIQPKYVKLTDKEIVQKFPYMIYRESKTHLFIQKDSGEFHNYWEVDTIERIPESDKMRKFAWKTDEPKVKSAIWQVSFMKFPPDSRTWDNPPGLVASGPAQMDKKEGQYFTFHVDFNKVFNPEKREVVYHKEPGLKKDLKPAVKLKPRESQSGTKTQVQTAKPIQKEEIKASDIKARQLKIESTEYKGLQSALFDQLIPLDVNYYVRVVTFTSDGKFADTPSEPVKIIYGELKQSDVEWVGDSNYKPPSNKPVCIHPDIKITRYVPLRTDHPQRMYHFEVIRDIPNPWGGAFYHKGDKLDFTPHKEDKSFLDKVGDFFSDVFSFVADAVNWVATAYNDIKAWVIDQAVNILGEEFRGPLTFGLEVALASVGLPPSLPNYDELCAMGKDYLIKSVASYAGVPPEESAKAINMLLDEVEKQANGGGDPSVWLKPDADYYYSPARLDLRITNTGSQPTNKVYGRISISIPDDQDEDLFDVPNVYIPSLMPNETITMSVFCAEYMKNRQLDTSPYAGMHRFWDHYYNYRARVSVSSMTSDTYQNQFQQTQAFWLEKPYQGVEVVTPAPPVATPAN